MVKKRLVTIVGVVIGGLFLFALVAAAAGGYGSSSDPLVTLSYLTDVFTPDMDKLIEEKAEAQATKLSASLDGRLSALEQRVEAAEGVVAAANYTALSLKSGESLRLEAGSELLLRSGSASCGAALTDLSGTAALAAGQALTPNHLYLADAACSVTVSADALLLVRGGYSLG